MVKVLILEYLKIKPTHGYEIQKYIQAAGFSNWAKIKSGSIYYALSKMEKNGEVELVKEETKGSRVRRIYKITEKGINELNKALKLELKKYLVPIGTEKYLLPMFIANISKDEACKIIKEHIDSLKEELEYWKYWMDIKVAYSTSKVEKLSFEMTIQNIENSMKWHEALIEEYDEYVELAKKQGEIIRAFDFDEVEDVKSGNNSKQADTKRVNELKDIIINKPEESKEALEELLILVNKNN